MRNLENELKNKTVDYSELIQYGFIKYGDQYVYEDIILNGQFKIVVAFSEQENMSRIFDSNSDEEYILADIENSVGKFVGQVRQEYESKLQDIISNCTKPNIFKSNQAKEIIDYVKEKYQDTLEFLWEKFDNNAIWRNKINDKWYGLLLTVTGDKLNIESDKIIEIIDLRYEKNKTAEIIDNKKIFPGYHMNKSSWITIKLDNSVDTEEIFELIDNSYKLSLDGNKSKKYITQKS